MSLLHLFDPPKPPKLSKMPYVIHSSDDERRKVMYAQAWSKVERALNPEKALEKDKRDRDGKKRRGFVDRNKKAERKRAAKYRMLNPGKRAESMRRWREKVKQQAEAV